MKGPVEPAPDVILDARLTPRMSGGMRAYVEQLSRALPRVAPDLRVVRLECGDNGTLAEQAGLALDVRAERPRLVHWPTFFVPLLALRRPYVLTVHDLIALKFPAMHRPATVAYYRTVVPFLARRAARLLVGDDRSVADCERYLGVAPERCRVVPLGYDPALLARGERETGPRPFFLYAGNHRAHKDLPTLFRAWAALDVPVDLYVTGEGAAAVSTGYAREGAAIVALGDVPVDRLWRLYRGALALVHPALAEGFGISMLEAAAAGTPVIAADASLPGVLAGIAETFPAGDSRTLQALLQGAVADPNALRARADAGTVRARAYTWDRFASTIAGVYREVLEEASPR